jgi:hypothetical protein
MKYEVVVTYRGICTYIVEADTPEAARENASEAFSTGETAPVLGNEWEEIESVGDAHLIP